MQLDTQKARAIEADVLQVPLHLKLAEAREQLHGVLNAGEMQPLNIGARCALLGLEEFLHDASLEAMQLWSDLALATARRRRRAWWQRFLATGRRP